MGLLDSVLGAITGGQQGGDHPLLGAVVGMLANNSQLGGLGGLAAKMQQGGLGHVMDSWVSTGENLPISPDQLQNVLGNDTVAALAQQLGLGHGDLAGQLSQILPQVVNQLTPHGQAPQGGLGDVASILGQLMNR